MTEFDVVQITGPVISEPGSPVMTVRGTVAAVDGQLVKVWPDQPTGDGKLWFDLNDSTVIERNV